MRILVTGAAGFIGGNLVKSLLARMNDAEILGLDNMNDYYDVELKEYRLSLLQTSFGFKFVKGDIVDRDFIQKVFLSSVLKLSLTLQLKLEYEIA